MLQNCCCVGSAQRGKRAGSHSERAVPVGRGRREPCASVLHSPGDLEPFPLALECNPVLGKGKDLEHLIHSVCYFLQFVPFDCLLNLV